LEECGEQNLVGRTPPARLVEPATSADPQVKDGAPAQHYRDERGGPRHVPDGVNGDNVFGVAEAVAGIQGRNFAHIFFELGARQPVRMESNFQIPTVRIGFAQTGKNGIDQFTFGQFRVPTGIAGVAGNQRHTRQHGGYQRVEPVGEQATGRHDVFVLVLGSMMRYRKQDAILVLAKFAKGSFVVHTNEVLSELLRPP
jgi:hypothetical protein